MGVYEAIPSAFARVPRRFLRLAHASLAALGHRRQLSDRLFAPILGVVLMFPFAASRPALCRGGVLNRDTPTLLPEDLGLEVGMFRIDEATAARQE